VQLTHTYPAAGRAEPHSCLNALRSSPRILRGQP